MSSSREGRFIIHKKWDGPYQIGRVVVAKVGVEEADEKVLIVEASEFRVLAREDELANFGKKFSSLSASIGQVCVADEVFQDRGRYQR